MKSTGWFDHTQQRVRVHIWDEEVGGARRMYDVEMEYGESVPWLRFVEEPVAPGVEAPDTFTLPPDFAAALREALNQVHGERKPSEKVAALEAEVRVLREWLGAEAERAEHGQWTDLATAQRIIDTPREPSAKAVSAALGAIERVIDRDGNWRYHDRAQMREILQDAYTEDST